jgi:hypothetical protein
MVNRAFLRRAMLLGSILVAFCLCVSGHAQNRPVYVSTSLNDAYVTLANAKPLYKGHRAKAMAHIKSAVNMLGGKIAGKGRDREVGADSDAKLRSAQRLLQQSRSGLPAAAVSHVNEAIQEISLGLSAR